MALAKSAFAVGFYTLLSRILGFFRDILMASVLGAGGLADIFIVAFKLPNFFRRLFAEGAFNNAFVPMFSSILSKEGRGKAIRFSESIFSVMAVFLLGFTLVFQVAMPLVMLGFAPGFVDEPEKFDLAVLLTRITFPYLMFISLTALLTGVLNSFGRFSAGASAPIALNIILIWVLLYGKDYAPTPAHALACGVAAAGVVQFIWLYAVCFKNGVFIRLKKPTVSPQVKRTLKLMVPGMIGGGVTQINLWVDVMIGTLISGAVSYLWYADRVNQMPMALIGTALGVVLLPLLSKKVSEGKTQEVIHYKNRALEFALFATLPATAGFLAVAPLIMSALFERGAFSPEDARASALALQAFAVGLPAFVMIKIFQTGYFAQHDTKTPVKIAILCMVVNVVLNLLSVFFLQKIGFYPHVGIALATSIAGWVNAVLLAAGLLKRGLFKPDIQLRVRLIKLVCISLLMAVIIFYVNHLFAERLAAEAERIALLVMVIGLAAIVYFSAVFLTGVYQLNELKVLLARNKSKKR